MGVCVSTGPSTSGLTPAQRNELERERARDKQIERGIKDSFEKDSEEHKLLLLGPGESGKSTLFKQAIKLYGEGFNEEKRATYTDVIYENIIDNMKILIMQCEQFKLPLAESSASSSSFVLSRKYQAAFTKTVAEHIQILWKDEAICQAYDRRSSFQLTESCRYFFDKVMEVCEEDYIPSYDDVLRVRAKSTGITETKFQINEGKFKMLDVGGQRNERRKWVHCFDKVTAVIFVAALSEYDQVLVEDDETNRMIEAVTLFGDICNDETFRNTSIILFLNKNDLFQEKIQKVDLNCCFEDYDGGCDYETAVNFIQDTFLDQNEQDDKDVFVYITNATNTENINVTYTAVQHIVLKEALKRTGLLR